MKKKILIGSVIGACLMGLAGCAETGAVSEPTTTSLTTESTQDSTTSVTESTSAATETSVTQSTETSGESTTSSEKPTETEKDETESKAEGSSYTLSIKKAADGFEKVSDLSCESSDAKYSYVLKEDVSSHSIEAALEFDESALTDSQTGRIDDVMYVSGKNDSGYSVTAYRYIGPGATVSTYAGIEYVSENEVSASDVAELLSDDYIAY